MPKPVTEQLARLKEVRYAHNNQLAYSGAAARIIAADVSYNKNSLQAPLDESSQLYVFRSRLDTWPEHRVRELSSSWQSVMRISMHVATHYAVAMGRWNVVKPGLVRHDPYYVGFQIVFEDEATDEADTADEDFVFRLEGIEIEESNLVGTLLRELCQKRDSGELAILDDRLVPPKQTTDHTMFAV